jgi:hypothetical protein
MGDVETVVWVGCRQKKRFAGRKKRQRLQKLQQFKIL